MLINKNCSELNEIKQNYYLLEKYEEYLRRLLNNEDKYIVHNISSQNMLINQWNQLVTDLAGYIKSLKTWRLKDPLRAGKKYFKMKSNSYLNDVIKKSPSRIMFSPNYTEEQKRSTLKEIYELKKQEYRESIKGALNNLFGDSFKDGIEDDDIDVENQERRAPKPRKPLFLKPRKLPLKTEI